VAEVARALLGTDARLYNGAPDTNCGRVTIRVRQAGKETASPGPEAGARSMSQSVDPHGSRLPIKLDSTSNGEFAPIPLSAEHRRANALAHARASDDAKRVGLDRRAFLKAACGAASTLIAFNEAYAAAGERGGRFDLDPQARFDPEIAATQLEGREFIFDVQGHYVEPAAARRAKIGPDSFSFTTKRDCPLADRPGALSYLDCLGPEEFVKDVFLDSDTDMMVLSFVPSAPDAEPVTIREADAVRRIVDAMEGSHRLLLHGRVNPNQPDDLERMAELAERWGVCAWKTYTQFGPGGRGFYLDDEDTGIPFIERARALGVPIICVHKGVPFRPQSYEHSQCRDIGVVAKRYPEVAFIVYHSGFVPGRAEGPYREGPDQDGIDTLVRSVTENGVAPNGNVYAELGSTWRFLMRDPDGAAHGLGKLLKAVGEDNVLWGTDSIWYGSPQDQIQAFRTFQISEGYRERYGYPEITPLLRAKVFGLNGARVYGVDLEEILRTASSDRTARLRAAYRERPEPHFLTYGPRTRREFLALRRVHGADYP
jgi:predicted TIM-barrel fold metal-dependent hydrolase